MLMLDNPVYQRVAISIEMKTRSHSAKAEYKMKQLQRAEKNIKHTWIFLGMKLCQLGKVGEDINQSRQCAATKKTASVQFWNIERKVLSPVSVSRKLDVEEWVAVWQLATRIFCDNSRHNESRDNYLQDHILVKIFLSDTIFMSCWEAMLCKQTYKVLPNNKVPWSHWAKILSTN